jgi:hypothetical protein
VPPRGHDEAQPVLLNDLPIFRYTGIVNGATPILVRTSITCTQSAPPYGLREARDPLLFAAVLCDVLISERMKSA